MPDQPTMPQVQPSHQASLDRMAKAQGFPDYATMMAWHQHISDNLHPPTPTTLQSVGNFFHILMNNPGALLSRLMPQSSGIQNSSDALSDVNDNMR